MSTFPFRVWVIGATGLVGRAILDILLDAWKLPPEKIDCVASPEHAGTHFSHHGQEFVLQTSQPPLFNDSQHHFLLFATDAEISRQWVQFIAHISDDIPALSAKIPPHLTLIDSSSAYRLNPEIPLIIPEINGDILRTRPSLVASPNCTTIGFLLGILPFWKHLTIKRIFLSSYQAASGAGYQALKSLESDLVSDTQSSGNYFPFPLAHNCIPQIGTLNDAGFSQEEMKVMQETHKILNADIPLHVTCARIPVRMGHSEAVSLELALPLTQHQLQDIVTQDQEQTGGVSRAFASPLHSATSLKTVIGSSEVQLSRIRIHPTDACYLHLWIQFDNIRVGAATNVCRILSTMLK